MPNDMKRKLHIDTTEATDVTTHDTWEFFIKETLREMLSLITSVRDVQSPLSEASLAHLREKLARISTDFVNYTHAPQAKGTLTLVQELQANVYHQVGNLLSAGQSIVRFHNDPKLTDIIQDTTKRLSTRIDYLLRTDFDFARDNFAAAYNYNESPKVWCEELAQKLSAYREGGLPCDSEEITSAEGLPFRIHAHPGIVALVLQELIINAEKSFTSPVHPPIKITLTQEPQYLVLRVIDRGRGMSREEQNTMFKKGVSQTNSTGIGLWQIHRLAEAFDLTLSCESSVPNIGTTMRIAIPLLTT